MHASAHVRAHVTVNSRLRVWCALAAYPKWLRSWPGVRDQYLDFSLAVRSAIPLFAFSIFSGLLMPTVWLGEGAVRAGLLPTLDSAAQQVTRRVS
jgi:hypothetical protein